MDFRKKTLTISRAKEMDTVDYLSKLGYGPSKINGNDYWYHSPFRSENTPSFKINRRLNRWYDHGMGKGGNLVDFGILFYNCTVSELLEKLGGDFSLHQPIVGTSKIAPKPENNIRLLGDYSLASPALLHYLDQRRIPLEIADHFCREVRYGLDAKTYYGIGFKNDLGGWEIRNPYFKAGSSPKGITTFKNGGSEVIVLEGFMDFLSFMALHKNLPHDSLDFVVLNSLSFFEKAREFLESHGRIRLYLDNDKAGKDCAAHALSLGSKYIDESSLYKNHKDLNSWMVNFGRPTELP